MKQQELKIVIALSRAYRSLNDAIEKSLKGYGISLSEFGVLEFLYHKGAHPVQEIAQRILVTSGTITYVIDKLVKKDLAKRRQCTEDNRKYYIDLTEKGKNLIAQIFPLHEEHLKTMFSEIDETERERLIEDLFRLHNSIVAHGQVPGGSE